MSAAERGAMWWTARVKRARGTKQKAGPDLAKRRLPDADQIGAFPTDQRTAHLRVVHVQVAIVVALMRAIYTSVYATKRLPDGDARILDRSGGHRCAESPVRADGSACRFSA